MNNSVFGKNYSENYDLFYKTKNYEAECDFLELIFRKYNLEVKTILDLGCGTGGHLIPLSKRGYQVTGVERSADMLDIAKRKVEKEAVDAELVEGDISTLKTDRRFDAVISMFAVLGYQTQNSQVRKTCATVYNHLSTNGAFIFDIWNGLAVLSQRPVPVIKNFFNENQEIIRITEPVIDLLSHTVEVKYRLLVQEKEKMISNTSESHLVRFFFPQEIAYYLQSSGFHKVDFYPFMDLNQIVSDTTWSLTIVGRPG